MFTYKYYLKASKTHILFFQNVWWNMPPDPLPPTGQHLTHRLAKPVENTHCNNTIIKHLYDYNRFSMTIYTL